MKIPSSPSDQSFRGESGGLRVAGVDLLRSASSSASRSHHGPVMMEVNSSPGLEGIEKATGVDVAGKIIEFLEKIPALGKTRDRL